MHREAMRVGLAVHRDRLDAELAACADDPHGNLASICDEDFLDRRHARGFSCAIEKRLPSVSTAVASVMPSPARASGDLMIFPPDVATALHAASMSST